MSNAEWVAQKWRAVQHTYKSSVAPMAPYSIWCIYRSDVPPEYQFDITDDPTEGQALLFAAAPDLLDALERRGCSEGGSGCYAEKKSPPCHTCAAIAKAKGILV